MKFAEFIKSTDNLPKCEWLDLIGNTTFTTSADCFVEKVGPYKAQSAFMGFVNRRLSDSYSSLDQCFTRLRSFKAPEHPVVLLLGLHDFKVSSSSFDSLPEWISLVLTNNLVTPHTRARFLPVGRTPGSKAVHTHRCVFEDRQLTFVADEDMALRKILGNQETEHLVEWLPRKQEVAARHAAISRAKFALIHQVDGKDAHLIWDALYSGVVPVIIGNSTNYYFLEGLPVILVNSVKQIPFKDPERLDRLFQEKLESEIDLRKLSLKHWLASLKSVRHPARRYYGLNELDRKLENYLPERNGYFVELGANDGLAQSNTKYFEEIKGYKGVLVEAALNNFLACRRNRSGDTAIYCNACVSFDFPDRFVPIWYSSLMSAPQIEGSDVVDPIAHANKGKRFLDECDAIVEFGARASTLQSLLDDAGAPPRIDLLSLDVEGAELEVLKGLDLSARRFTYICVEARNIDRIMDFLGPAGYEMVEQLTFHDYLIADKTI